MAKISFAVDGKAVTVDVDPNMPLLYALRDDLKMKKPALGLRAGAMRRLHRAP